MHKGDRSQYSRDAQSHQELERRLLTQHLVGKNEDPKYAGGRTP